MDIYIDCPAGVVTLSELLANVNITDTVERLGLTIRIPKDGTLVLDTMSPQGWCRCVCMLWVDGPTPRIIHNDHNAGSYTGVTAQLRGRAGVLMEVFSQLQGLYIQYVLYDVDWGGWAVAAAGLREQKLWTYENLGRPLEFPRRCNVELNGLISHYMSNRNEVRRFLRNALNGQDEDVKFNWHIGYYDPDHISLLESLKEAST